MKILVINAGSSSLKYQLMDMDNEQIIAKGAGGYLELSQALRNVLASHEPNDARN